jgi:hypothetical protein
MRADAQHIAIATVARARRAGELELQAHRQSAPQPWVQLCQPAKGLSDP